MEDAEQEIILSLFQGLKDFQFRSPFRTCFYRLARNRGIDCLRSKRSRESTLARVGLSPWNREQEGPEQQALRREEIESLLGVFRTLPLKDRQLILMKDVPNAGISWMLWGPSHRYCTLNSKPPWRRIPVRKLRLCCRA